MHLLLIALTLVPYTGPVDEQTTWGADLHQIIVVKASTLMPPPLQRQILKYKREILRGCLDALGENLSADQVSRELLNSYQEALHGLGTKAPFADTCYRLGRLSALAAELAPPIRGLTPGSKSIQFRAFIMEMLDTFPLVISHEGENYLLKKSLTDYIDYVERRNTDRRKALADTLSQEDDSNNWRDQRSGAYGLAVLVYNDMVMDTARLWLYLWEEAGGDISSASYFRPANIRGRK